MALADNRLQRTTTLCALYFAQGLPWGFMLNALANYLTEQGIDDKQTGTLVSMILLPWTFKLVWAPLIDTISIPSMGRRRPWIVLAELLMAATLLGILAMGDLTKNVVLLGYMYFIHNCFASMQDVCTDALAVDILPHEEQGRVNGLMWGSKLVGKGGGTLVTAYLLANFGLPTAVFAQIIILLIIMMFPLLLIEREGEKRFPWSKGEAVEIKSNADSVRSVDEVLADLKRGFRLLTTSVFLLFTLLKIIGWGINEIISKTLYTQQLGWKATEVSYVNGFAMFSELTGALLGGWIADKISRKTAMYLGFGSYGAVIVIFGLGSSLWDQRWFTTAYLLINPGLLAMGSVGFLSMAMRISWTKSAATMFTIYMTISNVSHVGGNWLAGYVRDYFDYQASYVFAGACMLIPLVLLPLVRPKEVDDRAKEERDLDA